MPLSFPAFRGNILHDSLIYVNTNFRCIKRKPKFFIMFGALLTNLGAAMSVVVLFSANAKSTKRINAMAGVIHPVDDNSVLLTHVKSNTFPVVSPATNTICWTKTVTDRQHTLFPVIPYGGSVDGFVATDAPAALFHRLMMDKIDSLLMSIDLGGTAVFAFSGALTAGKKGMDILGMAIVASITAMGGGTVRDLLLGSVVPGESVFWMKDIQYLEICLVTTLATFYVWPTVEERMNWKGSEVPICTADALGLAAFSVLGTQKAASQGHPPMIWIISGLMSSCFGGIVRDVLCLQRPRVLYPERTLYATPPLIGSILYTTLTLTSPSLRRQKMAAMVSFLTVFVLRVVSFSTPLRLPHWKATGSMKET